MKSPNLFLVTLFTVLATGFVLAQTGWHHSRSSSVHAALCSDAAWRYRHCQTTHWRACLLQH